MSSRVPQNEDLPDDVVAGVPNNRGAFVLYPLFVLVSSYGLAGCLKSQNLGSKTINFASINPIGDITFRVFSTSPDFQPEWMVLSEESLIKRINFEYIIPLSLGSCGFPDPNKAISILYSFVWLPKVHRQRFHKNTDPIRGSRMFLSVALVTFLKH